jgi:uncharacterized protein (DUF608 family)
MAQNTTKPATKFQFTNVVVVDEDQIGCIVKTWDHHWKSKNRKPGYYYEVYVRSYNEIIEYHEEEIKYFIYNKILLEDEKVNY